MNFLDFDNYIIDFDGTIFDSIPFWYASPMLYLKDKNIIAKEGLLDRVDRFDCIETAHMLNIEYNLGMTDDEVLEDMINFVIKKYKYLNTFENAIELLKLLKDNNKNIYILTASPSSYVKPAIDHHSIDKYLDGFISCDDNKTSKSDGSAFLRLIKEFNLDKNKTIAIDDSKDAIRALNKLNIKSIAIRSDFYGIDKSIKEITLAYEYMPNLYKKFIGE